MRRKASKAFVENEDVVLAFAQAAERFRISPVELLRLSPIELDFINVCNFRLILLDIERQKRELAAMNGEDYDGNQTAGKITKDTQFL